MRAESAESDELNEGDTLTPESGFFPGSIKPIFKYNEGSEPYWLDPNREVQTRMDKDQLRDLITRVLEEAGLYSESAVELLMLTAATESKLGYYIKQIRGPALGIFQMEPRTHDDIWDNYLHYKQELTYIISDYTSTRGEHFDLESNLAYQILMSRIHYLRVPDPLPDADDVEGLAAYWKDHYNTYLGAGTVEKAIAMYNTYAV